MRNPQRRCGYTLFELLLVLAILIIAGSLAVPSYRSMMGGYKAQAAIDTVRSGLARARAKAIEQGRPYRLAVVLGKGNFRVAPDQDEYWSGGNGPGSDPAGKGLVLENALPKGVAFALKGEGRAPDGDTALPTSQVSPGSYKSVVVFQADGTAREDVEIAFQVQGARGMLLQLRALTGAVSVKQLGSN
jgi:Tfp pilus assembly protein FimT